MLLRFGFPLLETASAHPAQRGGGGGGLGQQSGGCLSGSVAESSGGPGRGFQPESCPDSSALSWHLLLNLH